MDVSLTGVRVERGGRRVLEVPELEFPAGTATAILGPNGAGKTTLLRVIAGLERPSRGEVRTGARADPFRDVAYVFQEDVFLRRSVRKNLELGLRLRRVEATQRRGRAEAAAALLGITHLLDRPAHAISSGEARRVSIARALTFDAPLLLLDEPLAGLDGQTYRRLLDDLPPLLARTNATTLLVTHDREEALRLADRLVVLIDGLICAAGTKHEVLSSPPSAAAADVLGFVVLAHAGHRVAVAPEALALGPGAVQFTLHVQHVLDLVDHGEIIGVVGDVPVRVRTADPTIALTEGAAVAVHATSCHCLADQAGGRDHSPVRQPEPQIRSAGASRHESGCDEEARSRFIVGGRDRHRR